MANTPLLILLGAALAAGTWARPAAAQAAAETATILSGTGQGTGSASRSMGGNVAGSLNRASQAIQGNGTRARGSGRRNQVPGMPRLRMGHEITTGPDALEGTGAAAFQMTNGATIRTTGRLRQPAAAAEAPTPTPAPVTP